MAKIKIKRGIESNLGTITLDDGEMAITTDTKKLYIGIGGGKYCLGSSSSLGDMLKSIYDTNNSGVVDSAEAIQKYTTATSGASYMGQYTKIASITVTGQYVDGNSVMLLNTTGSASGIQPKGILYFRVKQQNPMGGVPGIDLKITNTEAINESNFVAVITSNTTTSTIVELYYKAYNSYETMVFVPLLSNGMTFYSNQSYSTTLPTGTQTSCTPLITGIASKLATARNIALTGDVIGSATFDGSANISITTTLKTGLTWNDLAGV